MLSPAQWDGGGVQLLPWSLCLNYVAPTDCRSVLCYAVDCINRQWLSIIVT